MAAIILENVTKTYQRGKIRRGNLRQSLSYWWNNLRNKQEYFNALENIDLHIPAGEIFGIVGPNGAGKSTLLKLLSRITYPTKGKITIKGTLASLIEIGVGFHPELTGRENIYLNGAIHGMKKKQIDQKLESIISFSGLEPYLEMPVKQYSSGMYVRLAFSVAAHLETDILLLDEVLGVGDIEFKRKSIEKLTEKLSEGRTIIMVSHQMDMLKNLCTRGIYIKEGRVKFSGLIDDTIEEYIRDHGNVSEVNLRERKDRLGSGKVKVVGIRITDEKHQPLPVIHSGQKIVFVLSLESNEKIIHNVDIRLDVFDNMGQPWFVMSNNVSDGMFDQCPGNVTLECIIPKFPLSEGHFNVNVSLSVNYEKCDLVQNAIEIKVERGDFYRTGRVPSFTRGLLVDYHWKQQ